MQRFLVLVVVLAACGEQEVSPDASDAIELDAAADALLVDAMPAPTPSCTVAITPTPPPPASAPSAGTYCATWTRLDGLQDPFARYYDRVDVVLGAEPSVRWWTTGSGGSKEYVAGASVVDGCLVADPFVSPGAVQGSGPVPLCWTTTDVANGAIGWCSPSLADGHWTVRLERCE